MKVIEHCEQAWILLEEGGRLLFDVNCSHSAFSHCFTMELDGGEAARYRQEGAHYLNKLAEEIQDSAPGVRGSNSAYRDRTIHSQIGEAVVAAFKEYRNEN